MRRITFALAAFAALSVASCTAELVPENGGESEKGLRHIVLSASIDNSETKSFLDDDYMVIWEVGDKIAVYDGVAKREFTVTTCDGKSAEFEGDIAEDASEVSAAYPFSTAMVEDGVLNAYVPAVQTLASNNVAPDALASYAEPVALDGTLLFKNQASLVQVQITDDDAVASLVFKGNNSEVLAGTSKTVTLKPSTGNFKTGVYVMTINPTEFTKGITVTSHEAEAKVVFKTTASVSFPKNGGIDAGDIVNRDGTVTLPTTIMNEIQLRAWAANATMYESGETVKLGADIALANSAWTPVNSFIGNFDGQNHRISNIVVTNAKDNSGFIGTLGNGSNKSWLKNLMIGTADGSTYDGTSYFVLTSTEETNWRYVGAAAAYCHHGTTLENVVNFAKVEVSKDCMCKQRAGGVVGTCKNNVTLKNCVNYGSVTCNQENVTKYSTEVGLGGITGCIDGTGCKVEGCVNNGNVVNHFKYASHVSGIIGLMRYKTMVSECKNSGTINQAATCSPSGTGYAVRAAGITAYVVKDSEITKCENSGFITLSARQNANIHSTLGGIVGIVSQSVKVAGCTNSGDVMPSDTTSTGLCCGGIVGYITGATNVLTLTKAADGTWNKNTGSIYQKKEFGANAYLGGIVGNCNGSTESVVEYCENGGKVGASGIQRGKVTIAAGGITGASNCIIRNCKNTAEIAAFGAANNHTVYVAGICGNGTPKEVSDCINEGLLRIGKGTVNDRVGGILTIFDPSKTTMRNCTQKSTIWVSRGAAIKTGGLSAQVTTNQSAGNLVICEGCRVEATLLNCSQTCLDGGLVGVVFGLFDKTAVGTCQVGSAGNPVTVSGGRIQEYTTEVGADFTASNYTDYLYGSKNDAANAGSFDFTNVTFN